MNVCMHAHGCLEGRVEEEVGSQKLGDSVHVNTAAQPF